MKKRGRGRGENPRRDLGKYYCNYTLRFISCVPAPAGADSIIYRGSLIKIIIRALNRGGPSGSNVRPSVVGPCTCFSPSMLHPKRRKAL